MKTHIDSYKGDSPLMEELDAICEGRSKLDLAEEIWKLRRGPNGATWTEVDGFQGVLKHCHAAEACKVDLSEAVFCVHKGKFYALKLPDLISPATLRSPADG